jgi:hypothetical protein
MTTAKRTSVFGDDEHVIVAGSLDVGEIPEKKREANQLRQRLG